MSHEIDKKLVFLLAFICALTIGNLYLVQPLLQELADEFHQTATQVGIVATLAQLGYALGVLLVVPLGDLLERRSLMLCLLIAVALSLCLAALSPSLTCLCIASALIGFTTVVPQVIIPYAASLAEPSQRASVLGTVQSGLLVGILLARTVAGSIASLSNWRAVYKIAAVVTLFVMVLVRVKFPRQEGRLRLSYGELSRSMFSIFKSHSRLRRVSLSAAMNFAVFSSFWTTLTFLLNSSFHYGPGAAGLFGLIGIVGALIASLAGKTTDRRGALHVEFISITITLISFVLFLFATHSIFLLVLGVIVMDAGVQANHIACQADIISIDPEARSRLNGLYMFIRFVGGAAGSAVGAVMWHHWGWLGVSLSGIALCLVSYLPLLGLRPRKVKILLGEAFH